MTGIKFRRTRSEGDSTDFYFGDEDLGNAHCDVDDEAQIGTNEIDYAFINVGKALMVEAVLVSRV